jgi:AraC-like DNA-binding protein
MKIETLLACLSALALGHCLFLSIYCWNQRVVSHPHQWLAMLLAGLAIRLLKSVILVLFPDSPYLIPAVGLVGTSLIGVFLWFYVRSLGTDAAKNTLSSRDWVHFTPTLLIIIAQLIDTHEPMVFALYCLANLHLGLYMAWSWWWISNKQRQYALQWVRYLFAGLALIWLVFCAHLFVHEMSAYLLTTATATAVLYGISIWGIKRQGILLKHFENEENKRSEKSENLAQLREIAEEVERIFRQEKAYTDATLSVQKLAVKLHVQPYLLSKAVNFHLKKSFPELLNHYRIEEATQLLASPKHRHLSVEAIAYDSGFNTLSAFYTAFKKMHQVTPAEYQKRALAEG